MTQNRDQTLKAILEWAANKEDISAVLLTSSLVNPLAPVDEFSDLDIEIVFIDNTPYISDNSWLNQFGSPVAMVEEDETVFNGVHAMKMVLYEDHVKVDFKLFRKEKFIAECGKDTLPEDWDIGYKVLLDKDGITAAMRPPSHQVSIIRKPTAARFQQLINDFWWDTTYVAKCLARKDIFYAKFMSENMIRTDYLVPLLEWHIAIDHNWTITTNKHGRLFGSYLNDATWQLIGRTFSAGDIIANWNALLAMAELVSEVGQRLAGKLEYAYPRETERKVRKYLTEVRTHHR